jgi:hypothetical protein
MRRTSECGELGRERTTPRLSLAHCLTAGLSSPSPPNRFPLPPSSVVFPHVLQALVPSWAISGVEACLVSAQGLVSVPPSSPDRAVAQTVLENVLGLLLLLLAASPRDRLCDVFTSHDAARVLVDVVAGSEDKSRTPRSVELATQGLFVCRERQM